MAQLPTQTMNTDSDCPHGNELYSLECIHLILPLAMTPLKNNTSEYGDEEAHSKPKDDNLSLSGTTVDGEKIKLENKEERKASPVLRGYETLQELRQKTAAFRQGYLNWRKFKPQGAKGETADVFTRRKELAPPAKLDFVALRLLKQGHQQLTRGSVQGDDDVESMQLLDGGDDMSEIASKLRRKSSLGGASVLLQSSPRRPDAELLSIDVEDMMKDALAPVLLDVVKTVEEEDKWLRFYYNPFTPAEEQKALPVRNDTLSLLEARHEKSLIIPKYNRDPSTIKNWIMHLGVGQFHRSHQLVYLDDLLTKQLSDNEMSQVNKMSSNLESHLKSEGADSISNDKWGYCGVGLMPFDLKMATALRNQDLLYTVLSRSNITSSARIVGSMFDYVFAYKELDRALEHLFSSTLRIISLTITEKGYCQNVDGDLDIYHPFIKQDLELLQHEDIPTSSPQSAIGFIYLGIRERRKKNIPMFTVMSCDNLPENGHVAKTMIVQFANRINTELGQWITEHVRFPSTMVDRITPMTVMEHKEILAKDFGIYDEWPVVTEEFRQWVIEDNFSQGRPHWESVGALLVKEVKPFELMKLRLLNGGHSMTGYISYLAGYRFVDDAVNDVRLSSFLRAYMDEVTSTIRNVSVELERYKEKIVERFGNRLIKDTLLRLCEDGSTKLYNTLKDALLELVSESRHIQWASLGVASFILFLATAPDEVIKDGKKLLLTPMAKIIVDDASNPEKVSTFLKNVFGDTLGNHPIFINHVSLALFAIKLKSVDSVLNFGGVMEALFSKHLLCSSNMKEFLTFALKDDLQEPSLSHMTE